MARTADDADLHRHRRAGGLRAGAAAGTLARGLHRHRPRADAHLGGGANAGLGGAAGNEGVINNALLRAGLGRRSCAHDVHFRRRVWSHWCMCWCRSWCSPSGHRCRSWIWPPNRRPNRWALRAATVLFRIVLPQVIPGVLSGGLIVFALAASAFATPSIIGGRRLKVVADHHLRRIHRRLNWPLGAAIAVLLLISCWPLRSGQNRVVERRFKQVFQ